MYTCLYQWKQKGFRWAVGFKSTYSSHSSTRGIVIRIDLKKFSGSIWATKDRLEQKEKKKDRCYFLETLSESIPPPKNKHVMRSLSPSIYCFYVYRVKGNKWSISFIKYLWTLFSIIVSSMNCYLFEFEDICGPLHIPPLINVISIKIPML